MHEQPLNTTTNQNECKETAAAYQASSDYFYKVFYSNTKLFFPSCQKEIQYPVAHSITVLQDDSTKIN